MSDGGCRGSRHTDSNVNLPHRHLFFTSALYLNSYHPPLPSYLLTHPNLEAGGLGSITKVELNPLELVTLETTWLREIIFTRQRRIWTESPNFDFTNGFGETWVYSVKEISCDGSSDKKNAVWDAVEPGPSQGWLKGVILEDATEERRETDRPWVSQTEEYVIQRYTNILLYGIPKPLPPLTIDHVIILILCSHFDGSPCTSVQTQTTPPSPLNASHARFHTVVLSSTNTEALWLILSVFE